jgi:RimJ/RimL family protein N-acetyltransferase
MREIPVLESERLRIRPFLKIDLEPVHQLKVNVGWVNPHISKTQQFILQEHWLNWTILNTEQLAMLDQPPYGDRAVVLKKNGTLIGSVGLVACLDVYGQLPYFGSQQNCLATPEVGLLWIIDPAQQNKGYATEAAKSLVDYAFGSMRLQRLIATTEYDNLASQAVMGKLGMTIEHNPFPDPPWLQVVGILENKRL